MDIEKSGWVNGFIGVAIFSASLPATRIAVADFDPLFLTVARATIASLLAIFLLVIIPQKRPTRDNIISLIIVSFGVVLGFPLLTALALEHITSAHSVVFIGLLPLSTAIFGVLRAGDNPRPAFWLFSIAGTVLVAGFSLMQDTEISLIGDLYMVAAIIACGLGYAEGGKLSRTLGGWQVISWALLLSLPIMLPLTIYFMPSTFAYISTSAWLALAYVSMFSMLIGFVFWYRGLAQGGVANIGQLQLIQPFLGLALASLVVGEEVTLTMGIVCIAVIGCVVGAKKFAK